MPNLTLDLEIPYPPTHTGRLIVFPDLTKEIALFLWEDGRVARGEYYQAHEEGDENYIEWSVDTSVMNPIMEHHIYEFINPNREDE